LNHEELLDEIKSRGHWRVEIRSTEFQDNRLPSRAAMEKLMSSAAVSLRGQSYPCYPAEQVTYNGKWLEGQCAWPYHKEHWRLYESGQWIHYMGLAGAWVPREQLFEGRLPLPTPRPGYLHIRGDILYTLTEILRFAIGLVQGGILDPAIFLSIQLHNAHGYMLYENFERIFFLSQEFINPSDRPIELQKSVPAGQLPAVADQTALDMAVKVVEVFDWVPGEDGVRMLAEDQKKLVERRLGV
jgi:hypothetical protein